MDPRHAPRALVVPACLLLLLSLLLPVSSVAQRYDVIEPELADPAAFPHLRVTFAVRSPTGDPVDSPDRLTATVREAGVETRLALALRPPDRGVAWALAVDNSGSMAPLLPALRKALGGFVGGLASRGDMAALLTINDRTQVEVPFTADLAKVAAGLGELGVAGSRTELYNGIYEGLKLLEAPGLPSTRALLVISDGKDERRSSWSLDDGIAKAIETRVLVIAIGVAGGDESGLLNLQRLAEKTKGVYLQFGRGENWPEKLALVQRHVNARWEGSWDSKLPTDGGTHAFDLVVEVAGAAPATATLRTRTPFVEDPAVVAERRAEEERRLAEAKRRRQLVWGAAVLLLAAAVAGIVLAVRAVRRRRQQLAGLESALREERERQERSQQEIQSMLAKASEKIEGIETRVSQPVEPAASQLPAGAGTPGTVGPEGSAGKRRTVFQPGGGSAAAASGPVYRSGWLEVREGQLAGSRLPLLAGRTNLGREDDNHIVLDDDRVSLHHAAITLREGVFWLEDLGSTNGTLVGDGVRVGQPLALVDRMTVRFGGTVVVFRGEA